MSFLLEERSECYLAKGFGSDIAGVENYDHLAISGSRGSSGSHKQTAEEEELTVGPSAKREQNSSNVGGSYDSRRDASWLSKTELPAPQSSLGFFLPESEFDVDFNV